jgi:hypothetical protein
MSGGGGSSTNTIQNTTPWDIATPHLKTGLDSTLNLFNNSSIPVYQGQRVAPTNDMQMQGLQMQAQRAQQGSGVMNQAQDLNTATLRGDYLSHDSNPYLKGTFEEAARGVTDAYKGATSMNNSAFSRSGAFGGGNSAWEETMAKGQYGLGQNLSSLANNIYGGNYQQERNRQMQGMLFAPQQARADYQDATMLQGAGDSMQGLQQRQLDAQQAAWREQAMQPYSTLDWYSKQILPFAGLGGTQQSTGTQPSTSNPYATAAGLGTMGLAAYNSGLLGSIFGGAGAAGGAAASAASNAALAEAAMAGLVLL